MTEKNLDAETLEHWVNKFARHARTPNTADALRRDLKLFCRWCWETGRIPLPANQDTICAFLQAHAESRKITTLKRYLASVATLHNATVLFNPTLGEQVKTELALIAHNQAQADKAACANGGTIRFAKRRAAGLHENDLIKADALFGNSLRDLRDRAIVWVAFDTLMRASELAVMRVEDLHHIRDIHQVEHRLVKLPYSESDQYEHGQMRYISPHAAERLDAWLQAAGITEGYAFRGLDTKFAGPPGRDKKPARKAVLRKAATRQVIYRAIKNCAARLQAAGLTHFDITAYSAHSTRIGAAQDMLSEGISMLSLQQAGGWKTDVMPRQYAGEINPMEGGAAQLARKRGRVRKAMP